MKTLAGKLGYKNGMRVLLLNLPASVENPFQDLNHMEAASASGALQKQFDLVLGFAQDRAALAHVAKLSLAVLAADAKLWIAYPKQSAGLQTDITRDRGWEPLVDAGWIVVSIAAVDTTWSAVRFRPKHLVKSKREGGRSPAKRTAG